MSQLIYLAVWLTFCRGLPLPGSELHRNLYFFLCSISLFVFYQCFNFDQDSLFWNEKQTLTWFFWYKKIWKELACHRSLWLPSLATFQAFFTFAPVPFLHIPEDSGITLCFLNPKKKTFVIYSLSIYYSSSTGKIAEYITEDEKDQFDINTQ